MKKITKRLLLSCLLFVQLALVSQYIMAQQETSNLPTQTNSLTQLQQSQNEMNNSSMNLTQSNLTEMSLSDLINEALMESENLDKSLQRWQQQAIKSDQVINDLNSSLMNSQLVLARLQTRLDQWGQRLQENNEDLANAYEELDELDAKIEAAYAEIAAYQRKAKIQPWVFGIGGTLTAGGGALMGYGIPNDNMTATLIGGGIILGTGLVYIIGHTIFQWW